MVDFNTYGDGYQAGFSKGEGERHALANANSSLRSRLRDAEARVRELTIELSSWTAVQGG